MTVNVSKIVRVLAAPTGPTGTMEGVRIFANVTGGTGQYATWGQTGPTGQALGGPTGTFKEVYPVGATAFALAPTGTIKTVQIIGYSGPD
jgi:hypothetical protein